MRGLMGSFAVMPLAELVELLGRRSMSGTLTCERGSVRKSVHLREGTAVGAASNDPREYLGQLLINFGHIDEEQLTKAFRTQEETKIRLGKVLSMVGLVRPELVRDVLAIKIRETLLDVFLWDAGLFWLDDAPPEVVDDLDATVALADITREAEFRATAWTAFRGEFPSGAATLEVDASAIPSGAGPRTIDGRVIALAQEGKTVDEIGLTLHATDFHLYQRLYALAKTGVLRAAPAAIVPSGGEPTGAADLLDRARTLLGEGRDEDAERLAARAVELVPASASARAVHAVAERVLGDRLKADLLGGTLTPRLKVQPHDVARMRLSSADKYLLSRCDGRRDVRELTQIAPLRELEVLKAIRRFAQADLVELH